MGQLTQETAMRVADLMATDLATVRADDTIAEAVTALADAHVHGVPVIDQRRRLIGVLSTSDVLQAAAEAATQEEREELFDRTLVRELMTVKPQTIAPDDDLKEAARRMLYLEVHRLFVEVDGELVGVISQSDIVRAVATARA
jgi:CBS domain-containing protein